MAQVANAIYAKGPVVEEAAVAGEAGIYPGMLLKLNASGQVVKHTTEGGVLGDESLIAIEDAMQGNTIATVYTSGDVVQYIVPGVGAEVRLRIEDGQDVAIGSKIISAGNGLLKISGDLESGETLAKVVGVAQEENDLTGSDTVDTVSLVRIV